MVFSDVNVNLGDGYDNATGIFTVPPGGDGVYYFYFYTQADPLEYAIFLIRHNSTDICACKGDQTQNPGDETSTSCGAVSVLNEGK